MSDKPVVPEYDYEEPEEQDENEEVELVQGWHKLHKPIDQGEDERGPYDVIPLAMLRGGEAEPFKVHKKPMKHIIVDQSIPPRGWYKAKVERTKRIRPRPCYTEALLTSPYGGFCPVGCSFCYINNGSRGYRSTGLPTVDLNYPDKFRNQLAKMRISGAAYMTSFSEPFHYLESTYHITQRLTEMFVEDGLPIFYCTRHNPPDWAVEALLQNPYSYIQWSVNTSNARDYKKMSPGAANLHDIFDKVQDLSELGIYTSFQCNPIQAGITTLDELLDLVGIAGEIGLDHMIFKFAEQVFNARDIIIDRLRQRRFDTERINEFDSMLNQVIGGVYTIQEDVRIEWLDALLDATREAGVSMSTCYEYYDDGKAGANLAPFYTTSDQCHGRGVPVHFRPELGEPFQPLAGCYRKGCLYCADYGTEACNNEILLNAQALQYSDLRKIQLKSNDDDWSMQDSCARPEDAQYEKAVNPEWKTDAEIWDWELEEDD